MCFKCWKHTVWCDKAVYPPYDDGHLDLFFFIYDCFQDLVVSVRSCEVYDLAGVRSRLEGYDPGWKYTIFYNSIRSSKILIFHTVWIIPNTESIRSLGRKIYDRKVFALWWPIIKSRWSYSFSLMVAELQNLRIVLPAKWSYPFSFWIVNFQPWYTLGFRFFERKLVQNSSIPNFRKIDSFKQNLKTRKLNVQILWIKIRTDFGTVYPKIYHLPDKQWFTAWLTTVNRFPPSLTRFQPVFAWFSPF